MSTTTTPYRAIRRTLPKTIASTGLPQEEYNHLREHLKSVLIPGSVGFDGYGPSMRNKDQFLEWFGAQMDSIGPTYWPPGRRSGGMSWPKDRAEISDLILKVVVYMGKVRRRGGKEKRVDVAALGGVAGAIERINVWHEEKGELDVAESLWDQMVLPLSPEGEVADEEDWEQFVRWEMCFPSAAPSPIPGTCDSSSNTFINCTRPDERFKPVHAIRDFSL
ncbi:hypothetical protein HOY82DRAFT_622278 [Tuber indicum]|nr:hypothetical protein HOY82DRAFT_622278 [Tuber indicum]